jgi:plastocyanin
MTSGFPTCQWEVKTTDPLWVYCGQTNPISHCGAGMVFAVNPPATGNTFAAFQSNAEAQDGPGASATASNPYGGAPGSTPTDAPAVASTITAVIDGPASTWTTTYVSVPGSPDATPNAVPSVWTVVVGGDGQLAFNPPRVGAAIGDIVSFQFHSKNHTATQSSFNSPCTELAAPLAGNTAVFDSGLYVFHFSPMSLFFQIFILFTSQPTLQRHWPIPHLQHHRYHHLSSVVLLPTG